MLEEEVFKILTESGFPQNWRKNKFGPGISVSGSMKQSKVFLSKSEIILSQFLNKGVKKVLVAQNEAIKSVQGFFFP